MKGPKPVIKQAFKDEIIDDGQSWIDMTDDRNKSTHLYEESMSVEIFDKIQSQYFALLCGFKNHILQDEMNNDVYFKFGLTKKQFELIEN